MHLSSKSVIRKRRKLIVLGALGLIATVAIMGLLVYCEEPPLRIWQDGDAAEIHVETLGEYPTTINRIRLISVQDGRVVWEVKTRSGTPQIHAFRLRQGNNLVSLVDPYTGTYEIVSPENSHFFRMERGVRYKISLWGSKNWWPASGIVMFDKSQ